MATRTHADHQTLSPVPGFATVKGIRLIGSLNVARPSPGLIDSPGPGRPDSNDSNGATESRGCKPLRYLCMVALAKEPKNARSQRNRHMHLNPVALADGIWVSYLHVSFDSICSTRYIFKTQITISRYVRCRSHPDQIDHRSSSL